MARFCMVTTFYPPFNFGGDGIAIRELAQALVRRGHQVTVVHDVDTYAALARHDPAPEDPGGVEVIGVRSRVGAVAPLATHQTGHALFTARELRAVVSSGGFDVVNAHNASMMGGPGVLAAAGDAVRIYSTHDYWMVCPTHDLWRHKREPCTARQCVRCTIRHHRPPQLWRYTGQLRSALAEVDAFTAPSATCRDKHYEFGFPREMEVVPNLLASEPAPHSELSTPHPRPYFLYVGRLKRFKGLDDVVAAWRRYPDADLLIAGDGDHGPVLRRLAEGNPRVVFLGAVPPSRLAGYYRHAIASLMPTISFETFGMAVIESLRHGTPVLARRAGAPAEIIARCGGGALFDDASELLAAVRRLQRDCAFRDRLGAAGLSGYREHWSEEAVVPRYLDVVARAAQRRGRIDLAEALAPEPLSRAKVAV